MTVRITSHESDEDAKPHQSAIAAECRIGVIIPYLFESDPLCPKSPKW